MIGASHVFLSGHECGHRVRIDQREGEAEAYPAKYPDIVSRYQGPTCSTAGIATGIPTLCRDRRDSTRPIPESRHQSRHDVAITQPGKRSPSSREDWQAPWVGRSIGAWTGGLMQASVDHEAGQFWTIQAHSRPIPRRVCRLACRAMFRTARP